LVCLRLLHRLIVLQSTLLIRVASGRGMIMGGFWSGLLGGFIAWVATMLVAHPLYVLVNLRTETARLLHLYEPTDRDDRGMLAAWLAEREAAYRFCATQLQAFATSQTLVTSIVGRPPLDWHPKEAGEQLWKLAPLGPGADERASLRRAIGVALGLKF
jgi:hypothetical protein